RVAGPAGVRGGLQLAEPARATIELRGPAELSWVPGPRARLELRRGWAGVTADAPLELDADGARLFLEPGGQCDLELAAEGDANMTTRWLIPTTATVAIGGTVLAVLVHRGNVSLHRAEA